METIKKELIFGEGLLNPTLTGENTLTVRKYREGVHDFKKDEIFIGVFKDGLRILLQAKDDTKIMPFNKLPEDILVAEGCKSHAQLVKIFKETFYHDLKPIDQAAIIRFEILKVDGVPVVSINPE